VIRIALTALLLALAAAAQGSILSTIQIARKTADYEIAIKYPYTGVPTVDREIAAWAKAQADTFVAYVKNDRQGGDPWTLRIDYKIARSDGEMLEVLFKGQMADDGNHTHFTFTSFNYRMPGARRVSISDIVAPAAFAKMRAYAAAHMTAEDADFEAEVVEGGLAPTPQNFAAFVLTPATLTVYFTPDQLGDLTSAGGHTTIPLGELKGLLRNGAPAR
jgi:hypothetical protein